MFQKAKPELKMYNRWWQAFLAAFFLVLVIWAWVIFAPVQVGGQATYVIISGNSMEPHFHTGDLVIVHQVSNYLVGDIVAYRNAEVKSYVFHRIDGKNLDHFIFKGDNNSWLDSYQPSQAELVGKLWIHLRRVGNIVKWLRIPINMGILAACLGIIAMAVFFGLFKNGINMNKKNKREEINNEGKKSRRGFFSSLNIFSLTRVIGLYRSKTSAISTISNDRDPNLSGNRRNKNLGGLIEGLLFFLGFISLASLALMGFSFTRPIWVEVSDNFTYQQLGTFSYSSTVPAGVYDSNKVISGDPLFPNLNCKVNLQFNYAILGDQIRELTGTHQLTATILDDTSNWQRILPLESQTSFTGNTFETTTSLDLCQIEGIVAAMEQATGLGKSSYSLIIDPGIAITGSIDNRDLKATFEPKLQFLFNDIYFYLYQNETGIDFLNPTQTGLIEGTRRRENTILLLGLEPEVGKMRVLSIIGLGLSLCGLMILAFIFTEMVRRDQETLIQMKYGSMLVDVRDRALELSLAAIDVMAMDDIARLAEQHSSVILHEMHGLTHYYFVQGDQTIYRFMSTENEGISLEPSPMQLEENLRRGVERGEFQVYYQPIVSLPDGKIISVEALLRWKHPERGMIPATEFIFTVEKTNLKDWIGKWILQEACTQFKEWHNADFQINLAVNLSGRQLEENPVEIFEQTLHKTGMDPQYLQIEIPEASIVEKDPMVLNNLKNFREMGVTIFVDGFTGQLSLSTLKQFQINSIKIDRQVIAMIGDVKKTSMVSKLILEVHRMGLKVCAQGVETNEQLVFLRENMCDMAQGYLLGYPVPADEMTLLLRNGLILDHQDLKELLPPSGGEA